jgi:hypothetical protein
LSTSDRTIRKCSLANLTQAGLKRDKINDVLVDCAKTCDVNTPFDQLGRTRWDSGKTMAVHLDCTGEFQASSYASRLQNEEGFDMCEFIKDVIGGLGWRPNHIHKWECAGLKHQCPRMLRDLKAYPFWKLYKTKRDAEDKEWSEKEALAAAQTSSCVDDDLREVPKKKWRAGRGTFLLLLEHITVEMRNKTCLSYYYVRLVKCFKDHDDFLVILQEIIAAAKESWIEKHATNKPLPTLPPVKTIEVKRREVKEVFSFAKHHLTGHLTVGKHDPCAYHCVKHALGGCKEEHHHDCPECGKLHRFGENMARYYQTWCNTLCKAFEMELPTFQKAARTARATEAATVPNYNGRKVKKVFEEHGAHYGLVLHSDTDAKTKKVVLYFWANLVSFPPPPPPPHIRIFYIEMS